MSGAKAFDKVCIIELSKIFSTLCIKKLENCFCNNFVKFPATLIIFGALIAQRIYLCDVHLFSTSPNLPTVLAIFLQLWEISLTIDLDASHYLHSIRLLTFALSIRKRAPCNIIFIVYAN